jgi:hypothetical protein
MSSETDNFITLDDISEIQDVVNGDFIFTISKGIIYKLDFQNFIISKDNIDFYTTIESLSAQVVTNTQSLCAINGYINDNKNDLAEAINCRAQVNELSSSWDSTYTTVHSLSDTTWLPLPDENNALYSGAMIYYDGAVGDWKHTQPGTRGSVIVVNTSGVPVFGSASTVGGTFRYIDSDEITFPVRFWWRTSEYTFSNNITRFSKVIDLPPITDIYNFIQLNSNLYVSVGSASGTDPILRSRSITYTVNGVAAGQGAAGTLIIQDGNVDNKQPINIQVTITAAIQYISGRGTGPHPNITYGYTINGTPVAE